ncbi:MAG: hypothetical protein QME74_07130 [Candidatus Edwardsbacteria bacterium]|nr:hypothetical protein [Candidatus Edwardsbacteria bacterium]
MKRDSCLIAMALLIAGYAQASDRLLYAEAQVVASYSSFGHPHPDYLNEFGWYSMDQMDVMQKPSLGFDLVQRLSTETGDWGMFAVQARFAYDKTHNGYVEPQLYNAYLKVKPGFGDVWFGHNKPAFGLASYLDNHGTLLQPLSMYGYGFDRDWGMGYYRDFESGNLAFSATLGSGMPIYANGNYLFSGRISKGDLNQQNYNIGLSASYGRIMESMGYDMFDVAEIPVEQTMLGIDGSLFVGRWENRAELLWHRKADLRSAEPFPVLPGVLFHRITINLLSENRLKYEWQNIWRFGAGGEISTELGISYQLTPDFFIRTTAGLYDEQLKTVAQLYWYHKI